MSIIDSTIGVLSTLGLTATFVSTPPGHMALQVELPNNSQAFFVWSKIDEEDFHFRLARFWANDTPFSMIVCPSLPEAIAQTRVLLTQ